jgi:serine protease Do
MSSTEARELSGLSQELVALVERTAGGVAAIKAGPYRVVSGVSISRNLIAVADHTLKRSEQIPIQLATGTQATATVLGRDPRVDVAILKVQEEGILTPLHPADPTHLKAGMLAAVVGLTIDVGPSVSLGVLGAVGESRRTWRGGVLDQFLRLDVNLYPSQLGAAVVNADGALIGLATPGLSRHSNVAVPFATLQRLGNTLLEHGRIRQGYLGVGVQPVAVPKNLQEKAGIEISSGLMLLTVETSSPAERAGLQLGDILVKVNGAATSDVDELQDVLKGDAVGKRVEALLIRAGETVRATLEIAERPERGEKGE